MRGMQERISAEIAAAEPRAHLEFYCPENEPDSEVCLVRFRGDAQRAAFVRAVLFSWQAEGDRITYIKHLLAKKDFLPADESMQEWFNSMNATGVVVSPHPSHMATYFTRRDGATREFSYERLVNNLSDDRQTLLSWAKSGCSVINYIL